MPRLVIVILAALFALPATATAAPCPGADVCPYSGSTTIGNRTGGVLRFPQATAVGPACAGTRVVASSLGTTGTSIVTASPALAERTVLAGAGADEFSVSSVGGTFLPPKQAVRDSAPSATNNRRWRIIWSSLAYSRAAWARRASRRSRLRSGDRKSP